MKNSKLYNFKPIIVKSLLLFTLLRPLFSWDISHAADTHKSIPSEEIKITGDLLVSNSENNYAEFRGNVEAIQGNFIIKSNMLRIYYKQDINLKKNSAAGEETIKKIIAKGNVRIWSGKDYAETENAEYSTKDMRLILTGKNSKVVSGKNTMSASRITLNRATGEIKSERAVLVITPEKKKKSENK